MTTHRPSPSSTPTERVIAAGPLTREAGTARILHEHRADGPVGPPSDRVNPGLVDFRLRRVHHADELVIRGEARPGEMLYDGADTYSRSEPDEAWWRIPLFRIAPGVMPFSSPLWLLDALCGARADAQNVGEEKVREVQTTRIRLRIDRAHASRCSPQGLHFPSESPDSFPAEVWLDERGRVRRMACMWPLTVRRRSPRRLLLWASPLKEHWVCTEFWDFGVQGHIPSPDDPAAQADKSPSIRRVLQRVPEFQPAFDRYAAGEHSRLGAYGAANALGRWALPQADRELLERTFAVVEDLLTDRSLPDGRRIAGEFFDEVCEAGRARFEPYLGPASREWLDRNGW